MVGLLYPADEAIDQPVALLFEWEQGSDNVNTYDFELSKESDFSVIDFSENVVVPQVFINGLEENTEYFWRVKSSTNCAVGEFSEAFSFTVEGVLGTETFDISGLVAYPNPTTNILNVEAATTISSIEVLNVLGQTLYTKSTMANTTQIDLSTFQTGSYFVRVTADNTSNVLQIVKQ